VTFFRKPKAAPGMWANLDVASAGDQTRETTQREPPIATKSSSKAMTKSGVPSAFTKRRAPGSRGSSRQSRRRLQPQFQAVNSNHRHRPRTHLSNLPSSEGPVGVKLLLPDSLRGLRYGGGQRSPEGEWTVTKMLLRTAVTVFNRYYREKRMRLHTSVMPTKFSKPLKENSIQRS